MSSEESKEVTARLGCAEAGGAGFTGGKGRYIPYSAYKDSGVEWLGMIPAHWDVKRLKYVAPLRESRLDSKREEDIYVGLEHIESWTGRLRIDVQPESVESVVGRFEAGDVLFGKLRPYLAKAARPEFAGVSTSELLTLCPVECSQSYLLFSLLTDSFIRWADAHTYGTRMPRVGPDQFENIFTPLPPSPEQHAITAFLDRETAKIDALVAKKERLIELLQEKRAALITRAVTKGLDPDVLMKDSGVEWLGEIPVHWKISKLKTMVPGVTVGIVVTPAKYYVEDGIPCLRSLNITRGYLTTDDLVFISSSVNALHRKSQIFDGDIVVVRTGRAGTAAVVPSDFDGANCVDLLIIRRSNHFSPQYLYYFLNSKIVRSQASVNSVGSIQEHYNTGTLSNLFVPEVSVSEQCSIADHLDRESTKIDALVAKVREAIDRLKELRTAVISAAVTGKIDVREAAG